MNLNSDCNCDSDFMCVFNLILIVIASLFKAAQLRLDQSQYLVLMSVYDDLSVFVAGHQSTAHRLFFFSFRLQRCRLPTIQCLITMSKFTIRIRSDSNVYRWRRHAIVSVALIFGVTVRKNDLMNYAQDNCEQEHQRDHFLANWNSEKPCQSVREVGRVLWLPSPAPGTNYRDLSNNQLVGTIPPEMGNLTQLTNLCVQQA